MLTFKSLSTRSQGTTVTTKIAMSNDYLDSCRGNSVEILPPSTWPTETYLDFTESLKAPECVIGEFDEQWGGHCIQQDSKQVGYIPCKYTDAFQLLLSKIAAQKTCIRCLSIDLDSRGEAAYSAEAKVLLGLNDLPRRILVDHQRVRFIVGWIVFSVLILPFTPGRRSFPRGAEDIVFVQWEVEELERRRKAHVALQDSRLVATSRDSHWKASP